MQHPLKRLYMRARTNYISILSVSLSVIIVISLFTSSAFGSAVVNTGAAPLQPQVNGSFPVSIENPGSYIEPTNTFSDTDISGAAPTYYFVTQDPNKEYLTDASHPAYSITYKGVSFDVTGHVYYLPANPSKNGMSDIYNITKGLLAPNSTYFFDDGTYTDSNPDGLATVRISNYNLSLIGLNSDASGPKTILTKDPVNGYMQRNTIRHQNVYFENLIFDGQEKNMGTTTSLGQCLFFVSGVDGEYNGSSGFVMNECTIQNVGFTNSYNFWQTPNKNVVFNFFASKGQHNIESLKMKNIRTQIGFGIISFNQATENYFKDITIDGSLASPDSTLVKIETGTLVPGAPLKATINNVFTGTLSLTSGNTNDLVYIQDFGYKSTVVPQAYRYAQYSTSNGNSYSSAVNVSTTLPAAASRKAVLDLKDNYWIVQSGLTGNLDVSHQLGYILTIMTKVAAAGSTIPGANIKLVSDAGILPSFDVPNMGDGRLVNIVAVAAASESYSSTASVPLSAGAIITISTTNAAFVRLYNIDFDQNAKYTLQKAVSGINPALVTPTDPNESGKIPGYPKYAGYASSLAAKVTNANAANFENCRFTSLASEIEIKAAVSKIGVGSSTVFTAQLKDSETNSYTGSGAEAGMKGTANDQTINWYSSDPTVVSIDKTTGLAAARSPGSVTITAKAIDVNNNGEIEKPYALFSLQAVLPFTITYSGSGNTGGSLTNNVYTYLSGDTALVSAKDTLIKDGYDFIGWNTKANGSGISYLPGDQLEISGNMELFAQWALIPVATTPPPAPTAAAEVTTTPVPTAAPSPAAGILGEYRTTTPAPAATAPAAPESAVLSATQTPAASAAKTGETANPAIMTFGVITALLSGSLLVLVIRRKKKEADLSSLE